MSTEALNRNRLSDSASPEDRDERARAAVKVFRSLQYGLSGYAKAITGDKKVRVQITHLYPHTDGKIIYYRPPIRLGDKTPHQRGVCDQRDITTGLLICPACSVREEVLVNIYHEIAHIAFGTFAESSPAARANALHKAIEEWGGKYAEQLKKSFETAPQAITSSYMGLANMISPYLPHVVNCLEDARVDSAMFRARKGTRKMLTADTFALIRDGIPNDDTGEPTHWSQAPLNGQASLACYLHGAGYVGWEEYLHPDVVAAMQDVEMVKLLDRIPKCNDAADTYHLSFPILARLRELGFYKMPDEQEEEKSDESEDSGDPAPEADPDDEADGESGEEGGEEDGPEDPQGAGSTEPSEGDQGSEPGEGGAPQGGDQEGDPAESDSSDGDAAGEADGPSQQGEGGEASGDGSERDASESEPGDEKASDTAPDDESESTDGQGEGQGDEASGGAGEPDEQPEAFDDGRGAGEGEDREGADGGSDDLQRPESGPADGPERPEAAGADRQASADGESGGADASGQQDSSGADAPGQRGEVDDSDSDGVPEEPAGSADESRGASGEGNGESEPTPEGQDSNEGNGGDQQAGTDEDVNPAEQPGAEQPAREGVGDGEGDDPSGDGSTGSDSAPADHLGTPTPADQSDDSHEDGDSEPGQPDDRPNGDDGADLEDVMESGADEGRGGVQVVRPDEPRPEMGTPEEVEGALSSVHGEQMDRSDMPESVMEADADEKALAIAIVQGLYFETPSTEVTEVFVHEQGQGPGFEGHRSFSAAERGYLGIDVDLADMPEQLFGPALLELRRIFSDNKNFAMDRNRRSGRIDKKVLGRRAWSGDDRLFAKKQIPAKKDYAVLIGVDISSSTLGDNLVLAKRAAFAQADLCARLGVTFAVYAHSANGSWATHGLSMDIHIVKGWDDPWNTEAIGTLSGLIGNGGNVDGHTMEYYRKQLDLRDETDKVLMYYTDGKMPAANHDEELEVLQREIKKCNQLGYTLMGVGIRTDSPIRHGLDTVQVDDDNDIKKVVTHLGKRLRK